LISQALPDNPHIRFFESRQRGYVSVDIQPTSMQARMKIVSDVKDPKVGIASLRAFAVEGGRPGVVTA
jgi:alkaline phosphatase D